MNLSFAFCEAEPFVQQEARFLTIINGKISPVFVYITATSLGYFANSMIVSLYIERTK